MGEGGFDGVVEEGLFVRLPTFKAEGEQDAAEVFADGVIQVQDIEQAGGMAIPEGIQQIANVIGLAGLVAADFEQAPKRRAGDGGGFTVAPAAFAGLGKDLVEFDGGRAGDAGKAFIHVLNWLMVLTGIQGESV